MHFKAASLLLALASTAMGQTATSSPTTSTAASPSSGSASTTDLPGLINQLPRCALPCLESGAETIGCAVSDLTCLCSNSERLVTSVGGCILTAGCSTDDISKAADIAPQICSDVNDNPNASEIASASNLIADALSTSSTTSGNAAARTDVAMGAIGAAAAFAALAL